MITLQRSYISTEISGNNIKKDKMDFKVHGITRSSMNLTDYSHSKRPDISGTTRLIHVQSSKDGKETKYSTYTRKMVNRTMFSLQFQWNAWEKT